MKNYENILKLSRVSSRDPLGSKVLGATIKRAYLFMNFVFPLLLKFEDH